MPPAPTGEQLLATILKHDSKTTSYKFALLRALNDVVLGHPDLALTSELPVAEHLRTWLTQTCGTAWSELQTGVDSMQLYREQLPGAHANVTLRFGVRVSQEPCGWQYRLFACEVRSPMGTDVVHWLPLYRLLDDPDFRPDVLHFQQLRQVLAEL